MYNAYEGDCRINQPKDCGNKLTERMLNNLKNSWKDNNSFPN